MLLDKDNLRDHNHAVDTREMQALLHHCLNRSYAESNERNHWKLQKVVYNSHRGSQHSPCSQRIAKGKASFLDMRFLGRFSFNSSVAKSSATAKTRCVDFQNIPNQRVALCQKDQDSLNISHCEHGYGNESAVTNLIGAKHTTSFLEDALQFVGNLF